MKKIVTLLFALFLAVTASAQSHIFPAYDSNNVFTGSNSFNGPFLLPSLGIGCLATTAGGTVTVTAGCGGAGLTSFMGRTTPAAVLLSTDVNTVIGALTNCTNPLFPYSPAAGGCIAPSSGAVFPATNGVVFNLTTSTSRTAISGTDFDNYNLVQLNNFRAALTNAANAPVNVVLVGDNDLNGSATTLSNAMYSQLRNYFSPFNVNGQTSTGVVPVFGQGAGVTLNPEWTKTGTLTSSADLGPTQTGTNAFNSTAILTGTSTSVTFNAVTGYSTLVVYGETSTDTANGCTVVVNGGAPVTVGNTTTGTPGVYRTIVNVGLGTNTAVISGTASGNCRLYGIEWTNNVNGVSVHRAAHAFSTSGAWGSNVAAQLSYIAAISPAPQLAVIMLGRYDNLGNASLSTSTANFTNIVSQLRVINPQMAIIFMDEPPMNTNGSGITPAQIKTLEQSFGFTANTAYISLGDSFSTYANANTIGAMNGDGINLNDKGSLYAASLLFATITEGQVPSASTIGFATLFANTFQGMQTIINPSTSVGTVIPNLSFGASGAGFDEGLAWYDGSSVYPSTSVLKWRMGKAANNSFYGFNQTLGNNWISVAAATDAVTFNGNVSGITTLTAGTANIVTGNYTTMNVSGTLTANVLNSTNGLAATSSTLAPSVISMQVGGSAPDTGIELLVPASGSGASATCITLSGGCTLIPGSHINGFFYAGGLNILTLNYGTGTSTDQLIVVPAFINHPLKFDANGDFIINGGFLGFQTVSETIATTGIGSSPVCQSPSCSFNSGTITVNIDGSSTGGNFLTLTRTQARPAGLYCQVETPQDPGMSTSVTVSGTTTTVVTFNLLNGSVYNTSAKTVSVQYRCNVYF